MMMNFVSLTSTVSCLVELLDCFLLLDGRNANGEAIVACTMNWNSWHRRWCKDNQPRLLNCTRHPRQNVGDLEKVEYECIQVTFVEGGGALVVGCCG